MIKNKIKSREELVSLLDSLKKIDKSIGFTSGAFDLLHAGHVDYLEKAKSKCDILVVGVNTDTSVKSYKGDDRPINSEDRRVNVIAALESVDFVFLFSERRNQKNIEILKPNYYIKAGDYSANQLTSKEVIESIGGEVILIPVEESVSTTQLINKVCGSGKERIVQEENAEHVQLYSGKKSPALFLDRDGTINEEVMYLHDPDEFKFTKNALEGIKKFYEMGYRIIIVTNQPGIGMGYYSKHDFYAVNRKMLKAFSKIGILVDKIYFCPHSKADECKCRKPGQYFIKRAVDELNIDLKKSIMIGDKTSDIEFGSIAGMTTILMNHGFKGEDGEFDCRADYTVESLLQASEIILKYERNSF